MLLKYDIEIDNQTILANLKRLTNLVYKLLPNREEHLDWEKPLETIIEELAGMSRLFVGQQETYLTLIAKLEGLFTLNKEEDFLLFRRIIFECLSLLNEIGKICQE